MKGARIVGYHGNKKSKCLAFIKSGVLISCDDSKWLGRGMYFWDNKSNADYWLKEKIRKTELDCMEDGAIIQALIDCDEMLDLTDQSVVEELNNVWVLLRVRDKKFSYDAELGYKLNYILERIEDFSSISVIKGIGDYRDYYRRKGDDFFILKDSRIIEDVKVLYCVRCSNAIIEKIMEEVQNEKCIG